jgi:hypothetical protein
MVALGHRGLPHHHESGGRERSWYLAFGIGKIKDLNGLGASRHIVLPLKAEVSKQWYVDPVMTAYAVKS